MKEAVSLEGRSVGFGGLNFVAVKEGDRVDEEEREVGAPVEELMDREGYDCFQLMLSKGGQDEAPC